MVQTYDDRREQVNEIRKAQSRKGRDVAPLPPVANPERRVACERDFRLFCESYFADSFTLAWSPDHLRLIGVIEKAVLEGGLVAFAMPRGSGKTTLCRVAAKWAILYGHRRYVCLIGAAERHAENLLKAIKVTFSYSAELIGDFPESLWPVSKLENDAKKAGGQLFEGVPTNITWGQHQIVMPTIPGSPCSGSVVTSCGITGNLRGQFHVTAKGETIRPDLIILDDPQTRESAISLTQSQQRIDLLNGDILGMAGPGKAVTGFMPCTVIRKGDMADTILDRKKTPVWRGERTQLVNAWPTNDRLWTKYAELRAQDMEQGGDGAPATEFYAANREAMDAGARVAWPERYEPSELSAVQHVWNLRLRDEAAFFAEYQNEPLESADTGGFATADEIAGKINGVGEGVCPAGTTRLTAFIDVQGKALYYAVIAWNESMGGGIVEYGAHPDQRRQYFDLAGLKHTLEVEHGTGTMEGDIYAGLLRLIDRLCSKDWPAADGDPMRISRVLVDAGWGDSKTTVYEACRDTPHKALVEPSFGRGIKAGDKPMDQWPKKPREERGHGWRRRPAQGEGVWYVLYDANTWKTFVQRRLALPTGTPGALTLFQGPPSRHRMLAEHLTAETPVTTQGRERELVEWSHKNRARDNHLFDCVTGAAVAASLVGVKGAGHEERTVRKPPRRVSLADYLKGQR